MKKAKEQEEEEDNSSSTERYTVLAAYATFLRKEKGKTTAHATRKRVTGARESSLSSIQWSFQNGSSDIR